jgi:hypothetical protein
VLFTSGTVSDGVIKGAVHTPRLTRPHARLSFAQTAVLSPATPLAGLSHSSPLMARSTACIWNECPSYSGL